MSKIGGVTQFFYAAYEGYHYKMLGVFFLAEFPDESNGEGEAELFWLPLSEAAGHSSMSVMSGQPVKGCRKAKKDAEHECLDPT